MTLLLLALLVAILFAAWVVYPLLFNRWVDLEDAVPAGRVESESRRRNALAALKDAEYDHAAGKLDNEDYASLRGRLELEAMDAIRSDERPAGAAIPSGAERLHACGFRNPSGSRFCAGCGQRLA